MHPKFIAEQFRRIMDEYYGVQMPRLRAQSFVRQHPELVKEILVVGEIETCIRGYMAQLFAKDLGMEGNWPTGGDTDEYSDIYFLLLGERAIAAGYRLRDDCSLWQNQA